MKSRTQVAKEEDFYRNVLKTLNRSPFSFLLGGAYALERYTGISRDTKDLDIFVRPQDCGPLLEYMADHGFKAQFTFRHWLGKILSGTTLVDVIFGSGNGICLVDDLWFEHSVRGKILGFPVRMIPIEEMIWSKGYVMERNRYDGADIAHLIRARAGKIDWQRLIDRFGAHWRVLFSHLVLFGFIYPAERHRIPFHVINGLLERLAKESKAPAPEKKLCQGTLLSLWEYRTDLCTWGYRDARLPPKGRMTRKDICEWTDAFQEGHNGNGKKWKPPKLIKTSRRRS